MMARLWRWLGRLSSWIAGVVKQVGGGLGGGRNADDYAAKLSERPRDDYRP